MRYVVDKMKENLEANSLARYFEPLIASDPTTDNGLTPEATLALRQAEIDLAAVMRVDFSKGRLELERLSMLIGGGPGAAIVGQSMSARIIGKLPS